MKRAIVIIVILAAVGALGWWLVNRSNPALDPKDTPTATVRRGDIELLVEATGSIESNQDVEIKSKASGEVMKLPYDVSDRVPKYIEGQNEDKALLVELDAVDESRNVQRAKAQANASQARLNQAQENLAIARADLAAARPRAEANIEAAKATAVMAKLKLDRTLEFHRRIPVGVGLRGWRSLRDTRRIPGTAQRPYSRRAGTEGARRGSASGRSRATLVSAVSWS